MGENKLKNKGIRQGDVLLLSVPHAEGQIIQSDNKIVVAEGEVTGHRHIVQSDMPLNLLINGAKRFLEVTSPAEIIHDEHGPAKIAPGFWQIEIQREYDDEQEWRNVLD